MFLSVWSSKGASPAGCLSPGILPALFLSDTGFMPSSGCLLSDLARRRAAVKRTLRASRPGAATHAECLPVVCGAGHHFMPKMIPILGTKVTIPESQAGRPAVRTLCFHCKGKCSTPGRGTKEDSISLVVRPKKKVIPVTYLRRRG